MYLLFGFGIKKKRKMQKSKLISTASNKRLDTFIAEELGGFSRSYVKQLIDDGLVLVNGNLAKASAKIKEGDVVEITLPEIKETEILPQAIPIDIIYEDEAIAVINKPQGMVTHPAPGNYEGTLVNAIMYYIKDLSGINGELRPGIVHRLDKDTSGLLVVAKNDNAHRKLAEQIEKKIAKRKYIALCYGNIKQKSGVINTNIDRHKQDRKKMAVSKMGRNAITEYKVLANYGKYTLVEATLQTGRTHQIRVHMKHIGFPVVGDSLYTKAKCEYNLKGQMLHAYNLGFFHPTTNEYMEFFAPLPKYFTQILEKLEIS